MGIIIENSENTPQCEGSCDSHKGRVVEVFVSGHGWHRAKFNYCENAIQTDEDRGFTVETNNDKTKIKSWK